MKRFLIVFIILVFCSCTIGEWELVYDKRIERIKYLQGSWNAYNETIIYFDNGTTEVIRGHCDIDGNNLKKFRRDHYQLDDGEYRFEFY